LRYILVLQDRFVNQTANSTTEQPDAHGAACSAWIDAWLESQRLWLARWQAAAAHSMDAAVDMEVLRRHFSAETMPAAAVNIVSSFQTLLQQSIAQFAATGADPAPDVNLQTQWQQVLQAFALGPGREQHTAWQEYLQALSNYQARQQAVLQAYGEVFMQSLQAVRTHTEKPGAHAAGISSFRELYELWIEYGEQAFARLAEDESFIAVQAASVNAMSHFNLKRNALLEYWLKMYDLPTRSELNSVHLRLRELSTRVAELEQQVATPVAAKATVRRSSAKRAKKKS
jgi:class III poly(R)-hydroxyalkanoic acid synthase PhaE subunit